MDGVDGTENLSSSLPSQEQSPSLLTIILDTNPAAWALLHPTLSLSSAVANILVFINAHLACNYINQVAVIASHCDKAQWLYPTALVQAPRQKEKEKSKNAASANEEDEAPTNRNKRTKLKSSSTLSNGTPSSIVETESKKYRPFRLIEEELVRNLRNLLSSTSPDVIQEKTSTMIAGALTLALSFINRRAQEYQESTTGISATLAEQSAATAADPSNSSNNTLQSRILIITLSPSTDLAHQYIPIMNSIFACQRLNIPIDVLQLPLPLNPKQPKPVATAASTTTASQSSTVFLQQASDATNGIFLAAQLTPPPNQQPTNTPIPTSIAKNAMLTYLLTSLLPTPATRLYLITPTRIDVDFRAACFCHRNVISTGFVCSICLSIFCDQSLDILDQEGCITCGTKLSVRSEGVGGWAGGKKPVVVAPKKKKKKKNRLAADGVSSGVATPRPVTPL